LYKNASSEFQAENGLRSKRFHRLFRKIKALLVFFFFGHAKVGARAKTVVFDKKLKHVLIL